MKIGLIDADLMWQKRANGRRYGKTKAEEAMLTPDMLQWSLGATIGIKFSKKPSTSILRPLWPWCFGNAAVESKGDPPIRRIVKGTGHLGKIDPIHGLLDALYCFDWSEGRIEQ